MKHFRLLVLSCLLLVQACSNKAEESKIQQQTTVIEKPNTTIANQHCSEIIIEMLISSDRYKELTKGLGDAVVKNGGSSYGLDFEGSPHPQEDSAIAYSETYDFSLHETYADHNTIVARFSFDTKKHQLYEYDVAEDSLKPVAFDKQLLSRLDASCK